MKVLMIEDSPTIVEYVRRALGGRRDIEFLPPARDGRAGVDAAVAHGPDVILMDLELPELPGVDAIREIMSARPCPIVVLSAHVGLGSGGLAFDALRAGAVEIMAKPGGLTGEQTDRFRQHLCALLDSALNVRPARPAPAPASAVPPPPAAVSGGLKFVAIGSSTGGLPVIYEILSRCPAPLPVPVLVAHHIMAGFDDGLRRWISRTGHPVEVPLAGMRPAPGKVYIVPAGHDLEVFSGRLALHPSDPDGPSPKIDRLFDTLAEDQGPAAAAVLLSGMGEDGAAGLGKLKAAGAITIAQAPSTCVVDGMPGAAIRQDAAGRILDPATCGEFLARLLR